MARAFLIEVPRAGINVEAATKFGEVQQIFGKDVRRSSIFKVVKFGNEILARLCELDFDYEHDYIVMTGGLIPVSIMSIAVTCAYPRVQLLFYNALQDEYILRTVSQLDWKGNYEKTNLESSEQVEDDGDLPQEDV